MGYMFSSAAASVPEFTAKLSRLSARVQKKGILLYPTNPSELFDQLVAKSFNMSVRDAPHRKYEVLTN